MLNMKSFSVSALGSGHIHLNVICSCLNHFEIFDLKAMMMLPLPFAWMK
jgi:hypothetical protein